MCGGSGVIITGVISLGQNPRMMHTFTNEDFNGKLLRYLAAISHSRFLAGGLFVRWLVCSH